jgi:hypothetical protein
MKIGSLIIRSLILFSLAAPAAYSQVMRGCPAGHAIQGIDFAGRSLICVPVVSPEALNAEAAARLAADDAALSNAKAYTDTKLAEADAVKVITVNCNEGKTIGGILAGEGTKQPLVLRLQGTCAEHVNIGRDDVTLEDDGSTIAGSVTIDGAQRVVVDGLTITNPIGTGVTITNGGSATLQNNDISNNAAYGVFLRNASVAVVNNNKMINNGITGTDVDASGIGVAQASMVRASRNEIRENANTGIEVFDNSTYRGEGDIIAMRTSSPGRSAVDTFRAGLVDLRGVTVNGVVHVNQQSQLQVRNLAGAGGSSTITGNINVSGLSFLRLRSGVVRSSSMLSCVPLAICTCDGFPFNVCPVGP